MAFSATRRLLLKGGIGAAMSVAMADYVQAGETAMKKGNTAISPVMLTVSAYIAQALQKPLPDANTEKTNDREMPDINMQYMMAVMLLDGTASLEAAHDREAHAGPESARVAQARGALRG
jgi:hypothetical protein